MADHHSHRPTIKQTNKTFKKSGGHSTKSSLKDAAKGRTQRPAANERVHLKSSQQTKAARRNTAKQVQLKKRASLLASTKVLSGHAGEKKAPRVVAVLSLCSDVETEQLLGSLVAESAEGKSKRMGAIFQAQSVQRRSMHTIVADR